MEKPATTRMSIYLTIAILFFLEATLFDKMRIHGARPEILLVATLFFGFHFGIIRGTEVGFISGILKDIFSIGGFGNNIFLFLLMGFFSGFLKDRLFKENFILQFFLGCFSVLIWGPYGQLWSKALYTGFLTPILFFIFAKIYESRNI